MSSVAEAPLARKVVERASSGERTRELLFRLTLLSGLLIALVFLVVLVVAPKHGLIANARRPAGDGPPQAALTDASPAR